MRLASLFNLVFSIGGVSLALLVLSGWLLVRPLSRIARALLAMVAVWYTAISIYPLPHGLGRLWSRSFAPLARADVPPGRTAVVLLGSGSYTAVDWTNGRAAVLDPIGLSRTLEAARVYKLVDAAWVISSGGRVDPASADYALGETMKDTLVRLGVPASRVLVQDEAVDTHDEARNVARALPDMRVAHVVLVTSGVHMPRAVATFRDAGVPVIPAPAREDKPERMPWRAKYLPSQRGLFEAAIVAHEIAGYAYYRVRGWR